MKLLHSFNTDNQNNHSGGESTHHHKCNKEKLALVHDLETIRPELSVPHESGKRSKYPNRAVTKNIIISNEAFRIYKTII